MAIPAPLRCSALGLVLSLVAGCGAENGDADAGLPSWTPDCVEVGPPGESRWEAVCRAGDRVAALCESDAGLLVCARPVTEEDLDVARPRCPGTATVVCNEGDPMGPRLDEPECLDGAPPSCAL